MTVVVKNIIPSKFVENTQTTQYIADGCKTIIDKFTGTNTGVTNITLTVNLVVNAGTAGTGNEISRSRTIAPNETYTFPELVGHVLEPGNFISTLASAASQLVIRASGREVT